jgi:hypothetical protein
MFEPSCILIHIFWNLKISIMTMISLSKVSFSLCRFEVLRTYFAMWNTNAFCVCNIIKHFCMFIERTIRMNFISERSWLYFMFTLCKMGQQHQIKKKWVKVSWKKSKHKILSFWNFFPVILHMFMYFKCYFSKSVLLFNL